MGTQTFQSTGAPRRRPPRRRSLPLRRARPSTPPSRCGTQCRASLPQPTQRPQALAPSTAPPPAAAQS
uniref:Uncharacterized protein n=1 Tax=Arundo donax TaxID=35708 RepID=A0A0A9EQV7_ARUDO